MLVQPKTISLCSSRSNASLVVVLCFFSRTPHHQVIDTRPRVWPIWTVPCVYFCFSFWRERKVDFRPFVSETARSTPPQAGAFGYPAEVRSQQRERRTSTTCYCNVITSCASRKFTLLEKEIPARHRDKDRNFFISNRNCQKRKTKETFTRGVRRKLKTKNYTVQSRQKKNVHERPQT